MSEPTFRLSPAGEVRRDAMLDGLLDQMRTVHRGRRRRRRVLAAAGGGGAMILLSLVALRVMEPAQVAIPPGPIVQRVITEPGILDRYRPATTFTAEIIDDTTLLAALAEINRPAGLIRMAGETRLSRKVTDEKSVRHPEGV